MAYPFKKIEEDWQKYWADNKTFRTTEAGGKPKYYVLDMFPYPSGAGLHVGHPLGYIASDIVARYKRLNGFNVLHPMGYDSFGLPAEQYAIQTGQHPAITTKQNIARYRQQMDRIGFSFDWEREVQTSDPAYYRWTQWIFIQLFNSWYNPETNKAEAIDKLIQKFSSQDSKVNTGTQEKKWNECSEKEKSDVLMSYRLAYLDEAWVNWCPQLGTVLANEEVKDGVSERGGYPVERKLMPQWSLRITAYADRLLNDLEKIDWSESIKEAQRNWIGKSEGSSLKFHLTPNPSPQERGVDVIADQMAEYYTTDGQMWNLLVDKAKNMRINPTNAESVLWETLRNNNLGFKIRRQHIIDRFIVDFVCLSKKVVIEVDGDIHDYQQEEDRARTEVLNEKGFKVIRFKNEEVISKIDQVSKSIFDYLGKESDSNEDVKAFHEGNEEFTVTPPSGGGVRGGVIEVFTTRPDTVFGVTFLTLAPESELVQQITTADQKAKIDAYVHYARNRSERERQSEVKKVTGEFTGAYVIHPFTGKKVPVWVGEYVLAGYGTGAVMGVPAHDSRDHAFAKHFGLDIVQVIEAPKGWDIQKESFDGKEGKCINSDIIDGLEVKDAIKKIIAEIEKRGLGKGKTQYRLRDAIFGRQRYWGEPIPVYYKHLTPGPSPKERGDLIPCVVEEKHLPIKLPQIEKYLPTETGDPPLARADKWFYHPDKGVTTPPSGGGEGGGVMELTTMPGWAGSSWYYLRFMDPKCEKAFAGKDVLNYWKDVDLYIGGSEHATGHLLYVRFWTKFLYDLGYIPVIEPAKKLINQGMIVGESMMVQHNKKHKVALCGHVYSMWIKKELGNDISKSKEGSEESIIKSLVARGFRCEDFRQDIHALVDFVSDNTLDIEKFKDWNVVKEEFKDYEFVNNSRGTFVCTSLIEKMSKSKHNVVSPDFICNQYGADTLRLYEMFLGPLEMSKPWNTNGITGVYNFLNRFWRLFHKGEDSGAFEVSDAPADKNELKILHKTIKKIKSDIETYSFNTAVSQFMICTNDLTELKCNKRAVLEPLTVLLSPFAPHISEELWKKLGHKDSITFASFPAFDEKHTVDDSFAYPVSFNGKMRFNIELSLSLTPAEIEKEVLAFDQTQKYLEGKSPKKVIVVPKRIVNIVI